MNPPIKNLLWNQAETTSLPGLVLALVLAALFALLLSQAYIYFGQALSNRRLFARNFLLLTVTTTLVISIVKSSLALSLGLVGALSIVRFRAAIKEPEELAFLFVAISVGLGLGAGQPLVTAVAVAVILVLLAIRHFLRKPKESANLYVTVATTAPRKVQVSQILQALTESGASGSLRRLDETAESLEASFYVDFREVGCLERFSQRLRELSEGVRISCLEDRGLGG